MRKNIQKLLILIFFISSNVGFSNIQFTDQNQAGIFDVLNYQEVVEVNLEMDVDAVISNRRNTEKHPATFSFIDEKGNNQSWNINVNLRGKFRRSRCEEMPPLKLNFKKSDLKEKGFKKFDDFKLVTHCIEDESDAKELILKEYLAYKLYNQLTEESFRAQLLKINYFDTKTERTKQHWGIIIEDTAQMRNRIGAEKAAKGLNPQRDAFHAFSIKRMALFQYMIGNLDYDIASVKNIKLIKKDDKLIPIPYDFDFSFFVNAPYMTVSPEFEVTSLKDRFYLGFTEDLKHMEEVRALFLSNKNSIYQTVKQFKLLSKSSRRKTIFFLDSFFKNIENINTKPRPMLVGEIK